MGDVIARGMASVNATAIADISSYATVPAADNTYTIGLANKLIVNAGITTLADRVQVETATVVGTISTAGNATVIVTAAGVTGSPITFPVAVALSDTATAVAGKIRTALSGNANLTALYTVGGPGASVTLTRNAIANEDANLNISVANGTCAGLTAALISTHTQSACLAKTIAVSNINQADNTIVNLTIRLVYTNSAAITYPAGTVWKDGVVPVFTAGKTYLLLLVSYNKGVTWLASFVGEW